MHVEEDAKITYAYAWCAHGRKRAVCARAGHCEYQQGADGHYYGYFMAYPIVSVMATAMSQRLDYEGITWERGWTDGTALLAAHALAISH